MSSATGTSARIRIRPFSTSCAWRAPAPAGAGHWATAASRYTSDNSLRGQVYSADSQNAANRYTADMGLRSAYAKNMPAQAQRQAQAMAMQMAGGDMPRRDLLQHRALGLAARSGLRAARVEMAASGRIGR